MTQKYKVSEQALMEHARKHPLYPELIRSLTSMQLEPVVVWPASGAPVCTVQVKGTLFGVNLEVHIYVSTPQIMERRSVNTHHLEEKIRAYVKSAAVNKDAIFEWLDANGLRRDNKPVNSRNTFLAPNTEMTFVIFLMNAAQSTVNVLMESVRQTARYMVDSHPEMDRVKLYLADTERKNRVERVKSALKSPFDLAHKLGVPHEELHSLLDELLVQGVMDA